MLLIREIYMDEINKNIEIACQGLRSLQNAFMPTVVQREERASREREQRQQLSLACEKAGIALVEDCAHSLGSTLENHHTGGYGIAGVYSLYATKAISAGEGGIAITNDSDLAKMLSRFNIYDRFDQKQEIGINLDSSEDFYLVDPTVCEPIHWARLQAIGGI